jgi:hypothetical protein
MYCANASRTPTTSAMSVTRVWVSFAADASDESDVHLLREARNLVDPDQNCHCLSLVWLHNIDYQTLHYLRVAILPFRSVPSRAPDRDLLVVADIPDQSHAMI